MTSVLYEHPLNERIRNYLKLEQLFAQADSCSPDNISNNYHVFFNAIFAILGTLERNDIRGELIKDLERLEQHLVLWSQSPEINSSALEENLKQTDFNNQILYIYIFQFKKISLCLFIKRIDLIMFNRFYLFVLNKL